ncbi:MAG: Asp-tRNA(Asn)/Glu-tRNA(Gln) amidotransferase subunit GatB [Nanoarchaeota archaeon]|nr:Asp-tRNA(Asn)/Glu-tRNA(Gln) amidotransferase subunit GatB [Nanoarchaeota archaeon]
MNFTTDVVIGLEVHIELKTNTKLFCGCSRIGSQEPNSRTCEICLGHPGSKPVVNKKAIDFALKLALATKSKIASNLIFSRKSYFYPDLSKNYQISQYELPLAESGQLTLSDGKKINLTRIHLEEDPASLVHPSGIAASNYVLIDYNRSGNPLVELVTKPEMTSPGEARNFMKQLITILEYLEIFDSNECIIKADANVSIKESDYQRVEVKNITGFKEIERALRYEVARQKTAVKENEKIQAETRSWDADSGTSTPLRLKESEEEYGYIIDPDLVQIELTKEWIKSIESEMPELAHEKSKKFSEQGISEEMATIISKDKALAELYEAVSKKVDPELAAKWIRRELPRVLKYAKKKLEDTEIKDHHLIDLLKLIKASKITETVGQKILETLVHTNLDIKEYIKAEKLETVADTNELEIHCKAAIKEAPQAVEDYKAGNEKSLNFIVGLVMRATKGKASPPEVLAVLKKLL